MLNPHYCKPSSISSQRRGSISTALRNNQGTEGVFMIRHFNGNRILSRLTWCWPSLCPVYPQRMSPSTLQTHTQWTSTSERSALEVKEVVAESAKSRRFSHLQVTDEAEITLGGGLNFFTFESGPKNISPFRYPALFVQRSETVLFVRSRVVWYVICWSKAMNLVGKSSLAWNIKEFKIYWYIKEWYHRKVIQCISQMFSHFFNWFKGELCAFVSNEAGGRASHRVMSTVLGNVNKRWWLLITGRVCVVVP